MEGDLKILKVRYLRNHWLNLPQILNLSSGTQKRLKWRWPSMEDNLKILNVEYLSNHWSDVKEPDQNLKWLKWRRPLMEDDLNILKVEYLSNHW